MQVKVPIGGGVPVVSTDPTTGLPAGTPAAPSENPAGQPVHGTTPGAPAAPPTPGQQAADPGTPGQPQGRSNIIRRTGPDRAAPTSPLQQFLPDVDPDKFQLTFEPGTGRVKVVAKAAPPAATPAAEPPASPGTPAPGTTPPPATPPAAPGAHPEIAALTAQVNQLQSTIALLAKASASGMSLGDLLGQGQPAKPAAPDFSQVDLYEPAQLSAFIADTVKSAFATAMEPYQGGLDDAKRRNQFTNTQMKHGADPNFNAKVAASIQLVSQNPTMTIDGAYEMVNSIAGLLTPAGTAPPPPPPAQPPATPPGRTITAAEQARLIAAANNLPSDGGVRAADTEAMPAHIKGLGQMLAWNLQQASMRNQ